ncbi:uncharacterized protein LOC119662096 [Teleopsis dalmanni]|uniref:uncharacterized protein LOC119662096 n=1 Tax=Teleopsis dalmanni TaxID=139649 RepID=UPI000D32CADC|nr:uncharacterized protein LOC119662096 [Teleopsis dalmanni]
MFRNIFSSAVRSMATKTPNYFFSHRSNEDKYNEDRYFNKKDAELLKQIRDNGKVVIQDKAPECPDDAEQNVSKPVSVLILRNTCCTSKYKDKGEEAYFINENTECIRNLKKKCSDSEKDSTNDIPVPIPDLEQS